MTGTPILQIACQAVASLRVNHRAQPGILIGSAEIYLLRALAKRDIVVILACPGQRPYQELVRALLNHALQIPGTRFWFVSTHHTGPLKPLAPPRAGE